MDIVYFVCLGASADIKDEDGKTPLQVAEEQLTYQSNAEAKQHYEKVHEDTHTITHFDIAIGCRENSYAFLILHKHVTCQT